MVASGGVLPDGYGHDGPGVRLWAMARRRPKDCRRKVDAATRFSGGCLNFCPGLKGSDCAAVLFVGGIGLVIVMADQHNTKA